MKNDVCIVYYSQNIDISFLEHIQVTVFHMTTSSTQQSDVIYNECFKHYFNSRCDITNYSGYLVYSDDINDAIEKENKIISTTEKNSQNIYISFLETEI